MENKEYINRTPIIERLSKDEDLKGFVELMCDRTVIAELKNAPIEDVVEVQHGYWYKHHGINICSHCQAMFDTDLTMLQVPSTWKMPNYCPNCGAEMNGDN